MKALKFILMGVVTLIAAFLTLGIFAPKDYNVERSIVINADKAIIINNVKSLQNMNKWSPWAKIDTTTVNTYTGTDGEVGSVHRWESNNEEVGVGEQEIKSISENKVVTELRFEKPFESISEAYMNLDEVDGGIKASWGFNGNSPFPFNAMLLFMDMDGMLGADFEKGLASLKELCEMEAQQAPVSAYEIKEFEFGPKTYIAKKAEMKMEEIGAFYGENLPKILDVVQKAKMNMTGAPTGIFYYYDMETGMTEMAASIPVQEANDNKVKGFEIINVEPTKALLIEYFGAYEDVGPAHEAMDAYMAENGMEQISMVFEEYITDPGQEPDTSKWQTNIIYLVK